MKNQELNPSRLFVLQPSGQERKVEQLATGVFSRMLKDVTNGKGCLKVKEKKIVLDPSVQISHPKSTYSHFGPRERLSFNKVVNTSISPRNIPSSNLTKLSKSYYPQIHPSELPINQERKDLHRSFFQDVVPQVLAKLETDETKESAYVLICGVSLDRTKSYCCYISEERSHAQLYNSCGPMDPCSPVLFFGEMREVPKSIMSDIRDRFPDREKGHIPVHGAFRIDGTGRNLTLTPISISYRDEELGYGDRFTEKQRTLRFGDFLVKLWTHRAREIVLDRALQELLVSNDQVIKQVANALLGSLQAKRQGVLTFEKRFRNFEQNRPQNMSKDVYEQELLKKAQTLEAKKIEKEEEQGYGELLLHRSRKKIPNSYAGLTFQLGLNHVLSSGQEVYKQVDRTGHIQSAHTSREKEAVRRKDDVHIPYRK